MSNTQSATLPVVSIVEAVELSPGLTHVCYLAEPVLRRVTASAEPNVALAGNLYRPSRGTALVGTVGASLLPPAQIPSDVDESDMRAAVFASEMRRREQPK